MAQSIELFLVRYDLEEYRGPIAICSSLSRAMNVKREINPFHESHIAIEKMTLDKSYSNGNMNPPEKVG